MTKLPFGVDIHNLIDDLRIFSWEAADILLFYSQMVKDSNCESDFIQTNNNKSPVTLADLKVNEYVVHKIEEKYKDINWKIITEENVKIEPGNFSESGDWLWLLDPLDGTKDFIQGTNNYAMHLALNYKNKSYIGLVLIPERNELWITNGKKTWCERRDGFVIRHQMIDSSKNKSLNEMILVTSKNHNNKILKNLIKKTKFKEVIVMGSIGCKITSILRGESDIYISLSLPGQSSPKDWDFAAPEAILKASGGAVTDLENNDITYNSSNFEQSGIIIASNNKVKHKSICLQLKEIIRKFDLYPLDFN